MANLVLKDAAAIVKKTEKSLASIKTGKLSSIVDFFSTININLDSVDMKGFVKFLKKREKKKRFGKAFCDCLLRLYSDRPFAMEFQTVQSILDSHTSDDIYFTPEDRLKLYQAIINFLSDTKFRLSLNDAERTFIDQKIPAIQFNMANSFIPNQDLNDVIDIVLPSRNAGAINATARVINDDDLSQRPMITGEDNEN